MTALLITVIVFFGMVGYKLDRILDELKRINREPR